MYPFKSISILCLWREEEVIYDRVLLRCLFSKANHKAASPGARVVDTKVGTEVILGSLPVKACANGDTIGGGPGAGDAHVNIVTACADDDGRHLHVPVDKTLSGVSYVGGSAIITVFFDIAGGKSLGLFESFGSGLQEGVVDLRSLRPDALKLKKLLVDADVNDFHYRTC